MILSNEKRLLFIFGVVVLCVIACFLAVSLAQDFKIANAAGWFTTLVALISGTLLILAFGMVFSEHTRPLGILYAVVFLAVPFFYTAANSYTDAIGYMNLGYFLGVLFGAILVFYYLRRYKEDRVVRAVRILLCFLWAIIMIFIVEELTLVFTINEFFAIIISAVAISVLTYLALKITVGINGSELLVLGPPASGKTYLAIGLWSVLINEGGKVKATAVMNSSGTDHSLPSQYTKIRMAGKNESPIDRTKMDQLIIHQIEVKKYGFIPVIWTIMDYAGEYCKAEYLNNERFEQACENLSKALDIKKVKSIRKRAGTLDLLNEINTRGHEKELFTNPEFVRDAIITMLFGKILSAGKIVFLIDGEKIADIDRNPWNVDILNQAFDAYITVVNEMAAQKLHKRYAYVVTKSDQICLENSDINAVLDDIMPGADSLSMISQDSQDSKRIEQKIADILMKEWITFKSVHNNVEQLTTHFIAVSVDPTVKKGESPGEGVGLELHPWGFPEVLRFGK